jgi:hypothetical protein
MKIKNFVSFILTIIILFGSISIGSDIPCSFTTANNGSLSTADSVIVKMQFEPSGTDSSFKIIPTNASWDSIVIIASAVKTDKYVFIKYTAFFGVDSIETIDFQRILMDSSYFTTAYWNKLVDTLNTKLERQNGLIWSMATFWGATNKTKMVYWPNTGASPKDSIQIIDSLGVCLMSIIYKHSNTSTVLDSTLVFHRVP